MLLNMENEIDICFIFTHLDYVLFLNSSLFLLKRMTHIVAESPSVNDRGRMARYKNKYAE